MKGQGRGSEEGWRGEERRREVKSNERKRVKGRGEE